MMYILMHKNVEVLSFELSSKNYIDKIIDIYNMEHLPFSTSKDIKLNQKTINEWWLDRSIPVSRDDYSNITNNLPNDSSLSLVVKSHALSLNDQYWIKKDNEKIDYDDISFFSNKYSTDVGDIIVGIKNSGNGINYYSPDSTSNGNLKKRWQNINGKNYLLKAGSRPNQYEIFNEIIASKVMSMLNIEHVDYKFVVDNNHIYCASLNFISYNEDFVTAYQLKNSKKQRNDISLYNHLLSIYKDIGIYNYQLVIDQMLFVDYILGNTDRHLNNFGVIRDAKTLEFLRAAPIYDTGSCLGFNLTDEEFKHEYNIEWKPFQSNKYPNQLKIISNYSWLDIDALKSIPKEVDKLLGHYSAYINVSRRETIIEFLVKRINDVLGILNEAEIKYVSSELSLLERSVINYIKSRNNELYDLKDLEKETGYSYITIYRTVSSLTEKGILIRVGSRKTGYWRLV